MAKKDKKSSDKKAKQAEKKAKQATKGDKKAKARQAKAAGSDAEDDVDLDEVLAEYERAQAQFHAITEVPSPAPPRARAAATLLASPANANQLLLFGGEYFNGALATFFNDLHVYFVDRDAWRTVTSPNAPLPRSGHAWCRGGNDAHAVYLFGGEFSSPKQGTFYHYNDLWRLDAASREWTRLEGSGKGSRAPPARSGHRMTSFKQYIVLFGGFQDTSQSTRYLADLWLYDTANFVWHNPTLPPAQLRPDARSSFTLLPHEGGAVLFGGYSRVKATTTATTAGGKKGKGNKQQSGGGGSNKNVLRSTIHQDCFYLRITPPAADAPPGAPPTVRWERRKKPANAPVPTRAGATMAYHRGRGILFGGVHDVEDSEDSIESEFFNELYAWNIERNRFFPLTMRRPRGNNNNAKGARGGEGGGGGRRGKAQAQEEELLQQLAALETTGGESAAALLEQQKQREEKEEEEKEEDGEPRREMPVRMELPHPRFNAQLAVQDDVLYIYGGTYEKGDREFTLDDMYAIDLGKMDGCKEVFARQTEDWVESEDEEDDEDDEDEDEDMEDDEDEDEDVEMADEEEQPKFTASKRKKKEEPQQADEVSNADTMEEDEAEGDTEAKEEDTSPHPRPFESRRDFFQRTSAEWQELLMTALRWKNIQPESLTIKELKTQAFEMSEAKWWDCREEITALEDEQEAAGISEVISLADRGGGGVGGAGAGGGSAGARRR